MSEIKRKRGRPKGGGSRDIFIKTRVSDSEYQIIKDTTKLTGKTISELIRIGTLKLSIEEMSRHDSSAENDC